MLTWIKEKPTSSPAWNMIFQIRTMLSRIERGYIDEKKRLFVCTVNSKFSSLSKSPIAHWIIFLNFFCDIRHGPSRCWMMARVRHCWVSGAVMWSFNQFFFFFFPYTKKQTLFSFSLCFHSSSSSRFFFWVSKAQAIALNGSRLTTNGKEKKMIIKQNVFDLDSVLVRLESSFVMLCVLCCCRMKIV